MFSMSSEEVAWPNTFNEDQLLLGIAELVHPKSSVDQLTQICCRVAEHAAPLWLCQVLLSERQQWVQERWALQARRGRSSRVGA